MIKEVVFDFDGVIADSLDFVLAVTNRYFERWGKETLTRESFRDQDLEQLYHSSRANFLEEIYLLFRIKSAIHRSLKEIPVHPHVVPVLDEISRKTRLSLLTSNSKGNVLDFLKVHHIHNYFHRVEANFMMFNKGRGLISLIKSESLTPRDVIYVGDEPRDIRAAKFAGVSPIVVDWGYSSRSLLAKFKPEKIVSTSDELKKALSIA